MHYPKAEIILWTLETAHSQRGASDYVAMSLLKYMLVVKCRIEPETVYGHTRDGLICGLIESNFHATF